MKTKPRIRVRLACVLLALAPGLLPLARAGSAGPGVLLVLNKSGNHLAIVDPETGRVMARVPTGEQPHEVAVSADGRYAFAANYGADERPGNSISMIDIAARKEARRIDLGGLSKPHGIVESGGRIYFTAEGSHAIARYDPASDRVDWIAGTGQMKTHLLAVTPDGRKIYASNAGSDTVTAIEQQEGIGIVRIAQIPVGQVPEGIACSPDGREVWVAHLADGGISIIDTLTDKVKLRIAAGVTPIRLRFTPDGRRVLVSNLRTGELTIIDARSRKAIRHLPVGDAPTNILINPDGSEAFVSLAGNNRIAAVDLETCNIKSTFDAGAGPDGLAWITGNPRIGTEVLPK
ncbi:MAG: YncE family protein [Blastocatellia bacterium]